MSHNGGRLKWIDETGSPDVGDGVDEGCDWGPTPPRGAKVQKILDTMSRRREPQDTQRDPVDPWDEASSPSGSDALAAELDSHIRRKPRNVARVKMLDAATLPEAPWTVMPHGMARIDEGISPNGVVTAPSARMKERAKKKQIALFVGGVVTGMLALAFLGDGLTAIRSELAGGLRSFRSQPTAMATGTTPVATNGVPIAAATPVAPAAPVVVTVRQTAMPAPPVATGPARPMVTVVRSAAPAGTTWDVSQLPVAQRGQTQPAQQRPATDPAAADNLAQVNALQQALAPKK